MKNIFIVILFVACIVGVIGSVNHSASSDLPAYQRTAIHAPAVATRMAGDVAAQSAEDQANAFEQESALVYAQAQERQGAQMRALATQQAAVSTQVANDISVSSEYATMVAVQMRATTEAITQTSETNRANYYTNMVAVEATKQAIYRNANDNAERSGTDKTIETFWKWFWPAVAAGVALLVLITGWRLSGLIGKRNDNDYETEKTPTTPITPDVKPAPPSQPLDIEKIKAKYAAYNMAIRYVEDSIRNNGGKSTKLLSAGEWETLGTNRDSHTIASGYLKDRGLIQTQQGGKPSDQGTFVQESGKDLVYLLGVLRTTPPPAV